MPNIAALLKTEIARLARKEVRAQTGTLKRAAGTYRSEIAALKRRTDAIERQLRHAQKAQHSAPSAEPKKQDAGLRFSPKGLASHRKRLGLSASDMGKLLGASGQSVYKWESGEARPRAATSPASRRFASSAERTSPRFSRASTTRVEKSSMHCNGSAHLPPTVSGCMPATIRR
jgi:DNA-binding transcriptional regulator YiaG